MCVGGGGTGDGVGWIGTVSRRAVSPSVRRCCSGGASIAARVCAMHKARVLAARPVLPRSFAHAAPPHLVRKVGSDEDERHVERAALEEELREVWEGGEMERWVWGWG